jgi:hypothetical protein
MLFNLFGKKGDGENGQLFTDIVWLDTPAKYQGLLAICKKEPGIIFIGWFADTISSFRNFLKENGIDENCVKDARTVSSHQLEGRPVIFLEHYPLHEKEKALVEELHIGQAVVHGALDEAVFVHFGSEKMLPMLKMLGFKASDPIQHAYVTSSVTKAQEKMAAKVVVEQAASSQAGWIEKNLKGE